MSAEELDPLPYCTYCHTFGHEYTDCPDEPIDDREKYLSPGTLGHSMPLHYPQLHDREWLAGQLDAGRTYDELVDTIGCSKIAVAVTIAKFGLTRNARVDLHHPLLSDREWLAARCDGALSQPGIAAAAGASVVSVRTWIDRHGLREQFIANRRRRIADGRMRRARRRASIPPKPPKYPGLRDLDWLAAATAERGCAQVAREVGCHVSSVMRALERHGITYTAPTGVFRKRGPAPYPDGVREAAVELYVEGHRPVEIAKLAGVPSTTVYQWAREAGVSRPRGRPRGRGTS